MAKKEFNVRHGLRVGNTLVIDSSGSWLGASIPDTQISVGSVTQHESALSISTTQLKGSPQLPDALVQVSNVTQHVGSIDHDLLLNFVLGEHFLQSAISIPASQISDFDTEVSNNASVSANTSKVTNATHTSHVTGSGALTLVVAAITGQAELTSGLASTDELVLSDGGVMKRMDISVVEAYMLANLAFNNYTHPAHAGDDFSVDSTLLSGATVISDIDINVTTDIEGHVTDANGSIATRELTAANIGAAATSHVHVATDITTGTLAVLRGGTGVTAKTGTGNVVLSATPTFTGTPVFGAIRINLDIDLNGNIVGDGVSTITGIETLTIDGTGDITKASHGNYLYHQSSVYDDDQEGGITLSTSAASGGADGDIWFRYTA